MTDRSQPDGITRRDFVNGTLYAAGAATLTACGPQASKAPNLEPSGSAWTGYGGVGDYSWSNGNTEAVRDAAHGIRDGVHDETQVTPTTESYDLVIVGGGFSGMAAAWEFHKSARRGERLLLLDNHPMFGGEAKQNEIEVDGVRLVGPQGSNAGLIPQGDLKGTRAETYAEYYRELGLPSAYPLEPLAGGAERLALPVDHYIPMVLEEDHPSAYFFRGKGWVKNPRADAFAATPWSPDVRKQMDDFVHNRRDGVAGREDADRWLDSMTYRQLLDRLGYGEEVSRYIDPYMAVANFGVGGDAVSAAAARRLALPGTYPSAAPNPFRQVDVVSFPGGNAAILRAMLRRMIPEAIEGPAGYAGTALGKIRFDALDRPTSNVRVRLGATVFRVEHEGALSGPVSVSYVRDGKQQHVRAKALVMASGGWVNRRIVRDLPASHLQAYASFNYGPVLTANVAVRNWRFFDKMGISVARWFHGIGWHLVARRNVALSPGTKPLTPDSPMMLTFYIPFLFPGREASTQGSLARQLLMQTSYAEFERQIRNQMDELFGSAGFNARRDIAGIVLNRWGHAFVAPGPGFFHGRDGEPAPPDLIRKPHGRITFGHSELQGLMNMASAMAEGKRAGLEALEIARG